MNDDRYRNAADPLHVEDLPEELWLEIFKWLAVDDLNGRVKLVCKRWYKIASTSHLRPNALVVSRRSNPKTVFHLLTKCNDALTRIEFRNVLEPGIATSLSLNRWPNLKTLCVKWKPNTWDGGCIQVARLMRMIERCPKLRGIELRECFVHGDVNALTAKLRDRGIQRITFANRYLVVDGMERLFELRNMIEFRVYCYFFGQLDAGSCIGKFCGNNKLSLTSLGLRLDNAGEDSIDGIVSCTRLRRLCLVGKFKIGIRGLLKIARLPELRCFSIEAYYVSADEFVTFLQSPFTRQLYQLHIYWSRRAEERELTSLVCCKNLSKLKLRFANNFHNADAICGTIVQLVEMLPLNEFKIVSDFSILDHLPHICFNTKDLYRIKLVQTNHEFESTFALKTKLDAVKRVYEFKCLIDGSRLEITLNKRICRRDFNESSFGLEAS